MFQIPRMQVIDTEYYILFIEFFYILVLLHILSFIFNYYLARDM